MRALMRSPLSCALRWQACNRLRMAGLVTVRRDGRSMIYAAQYEQMNALLGFLTENCCAGTPATSPRRLISHRTR
jgi:DNA-binding transcriptional ArsR family regulator